MTDPLGIQSSLPPLYAGWLSEALPGAIPAETKATCENCAMCQQNANTGSQAMFFNPNTKCCTYLPELANFLVGRILAEPDASTVPGRDRLEEWIDRGIAVTPFGAVKPPLYDLLYTQATDFFGKSEAMLCPYYIKEGGLCGIWQHRNSICATWYCKHNRGAVGFTFWRTLQKMLGMAERYLAVWCILQLDLGATALKKLFPVENPNQAGAMRTPLNAKQLDGIKDEDNYRVLWGNWLGREKDYYRVCGQLVSGLSWEQVLDIGGIELRMMDRLTLEAYQNLVSEEIPPRLQSGTFQIIRSGSNRHLVETYSIYDPLSMPRQLMEVLDYFDGRPTEEAVQAIYDEKDLNLTAGLIRKLTDFQVLRPTDS
ncbi:MAG: hypothetical protein J0I20_14225 [Chloroflexi bacterium]|nr:hypothetical protein [Chloroflexota bacterium]OJW02671.1 MAG: hypothetical protein BGO39_05375 [Chloroflexi bacterium 54-19]